MSTDSSVSALLQRFEGHTGTIGVAGMGYVGLPLAHAMHHAGHRVIGFDIDQHKIDMLRAGKAYLKHLGVEMVQDLSRSSRFLATNVPTDLASCDGICICVPTPLGTHQEPDLTFVERSTEMIATVLAGAKLAGPRGPRTGTPCLVSLESTTYPGTTREVCLPILERAGLELGTDFLLAFSPEREDPGRQGFETSTIPRLVGGIDEASTRAAHAMYASAIKHVHPVASAEVAEAAKLLENIYRAVNIAMVNELKPVFASMGIDIWQVIEAAATKPFGFQKFTPGPGLGGHCIPIDPFYLTWRAKEFGHTTRFIELAGQINNSMPHYVVEKTAEGLNQARKSLKGARVLIIGVAYKPDVDDMRETPAAEIVELLVQRGCVVEYHDPHVPQFPIMRRHRLDLSSVPLTAEKLAAADAVVIVTDHRMVDWTLIGQHARLVVDSRNAMSRAKGVRATIVKA
jgi:UDP-N-acetyl-D-glucosamine dehydrogenase